MIFAIAASTDSCELTSSSMARKSQFVTDAQGSFDNTEGTTQTNQLRRIIRYLKRWDDFQQTDETDAKLSSDHEIRDYIAPKRSAKFHHPHRLFCSSGALCMQLM